MNGSITEWNSFNGRGKVSGSDGDHPVSSGDCSTRLQAVLNNAAIPPDPPVPVTYDVAGTGEAINVDLAQTRALAAPATMMAAGTVAKKTAKSPAPKREAAKAPARTAKKKSAGKKDAAKKSRKQVRKSASKRSGP